MRASVFDKIHFVDAWFGDRHLPHPSQAQSAWNWEGRPRWKQVHGVAIHSVSSVNQDCGECDGLWSKAHNLPISVATADCTPILLAKRDGTEIAALHAGWRGTLDGIVYQFAQQVSQDRYPLKDWVAAIGPTIRSCCYEVSEELSTTFLTQFKNFSAKAIVPRFRHLELQAINALQLEQMGIGECQILPFCTSCTMEDGSHKFFSYRRDKAAQRQYSTIILRQNI